MWEIEGTPRDESNFEKDARIWVWTIRRGDDVRFVTVTITLPSMTGLAGDIREARESRGESVLQALLALDDPPTAITVTVEGIAY